jgi:hypothetical protein
LWPLRMKLCSNFAGCMDGRGWWHAASKQSQ